MESLASIRSFHPLSERIATAGQPTADHFPALRAAGYQVIVNLALPTSTDALPDEADLVARNGLEYVHIPVEWENPTVEDALRFFRVMDERNGQKILVHCAMNMRASAFMYLYRLRNGEPESTAARDLHAIWRPEGTWLNFIQTMARRTRPASQADASNHD